jgi:AAA domain
LTGISCASSTWSKRGFSRREPRSSSPGAVRLHGQSSHRMGRSRSATVATPRRQRPGRLRRTDGEGVYRAHRAARYATGAQLKMEARIAEASTQRGAPRADPDHAAELLGADRASLVAQLEPGTPADVHTVTRSGLLLNQAAAAFAILTSDRRIDVLVGPAGTGKSRTIVTIASIWPQLHPAAGSSR